MPALVRALKRLDLPTLGKPTMPHCRAMYSYVLAEGADVRVGACAKPTPPHGKATLYLCLRPAPSKPAWDAAMTVSWTSGAGWQRCQRADHIAMSGAA